jgi:heptosyltransferase I
MAALVNHKPTALLIRIDRIGDLVLTLPSDQNLALKNYNCHWFIAKGLGFVAQNSQPPRTYSEWQNQFSWSQFFHFIREIKKLQPEVSVSFHSPWWVNAALCWARVTKRVGVLSKWHSYLFLNAGVRTQ